MSRYNDPSHLPRPVRVPTLEDIDRDTDEKYDRYEQRKIDEETDDKDEEGK